ncbi:MAG: hypothetical protein M3R02_29195 [Chloroflexota bacterium]|nr:hypothetical protein [Chloroflexota bacterium]
MSAPTQERRRRAEISTPPHIPAGHPLWPLTVILGDVARRIERQRAAEHTETSPETRRVAGSDPAAPGETV